MTTHLLDTSVFTQPLRNRRSRIAIALQHWQALGDSQLAVSIVTIAETEFGIASSPAAASLLQKYHRYLRGRLAVVETDTRVWYEFIRIKVRQRHWANPSVTWIC